MLFLLFLAGVFAGQRCLRLAALRWLAVCLSLVPAAGVGLNLWFC
jgi:hypothetical protein